MAATPVRGRQGAVAHWRGTGTLEGQRREAGWRRRQAAPRPRQIDDRLPPAGETTARRWNRTDGRPARGGGPPGSCALI